jgi:hypothetical protein
VCWRFLWFLGRTPLSFSLAFKKMEKQRKAKSALLVQKEHVQHVFSQADSSFGIERLVRKALVISPYVFPTLYVRELSGYWGVLARKKAVELVVLAKLIILMLLVICPSARSWQAYVAIYSLAETILYLLAVILLSDIYAPPISKARSFILLFINYIEINISFSLIYYWLGCVKGMESKFDAVYFSFVTFTTLGYGDFLPNSPAAKFTVILEVLVMLMFVFLFFFNLAPEMKNANKANSADAKNRRG